MLAEQVVVVRRARAEGTKAVRLVQAHSGTLSHKDIEMLQHSFILMAGGDAPKNGLELHQLRELVVMAGLDPASTATRELVGELLERANEGAQPGARVQISLDAFMKVGLEQSWPCTLQFSPSLPLPLSSYSLPPSPPSGGNFLPGGVHSRHSGTG